MNSRLNLRRSLKESLDRCALLIEAILTIFYPSTTKRSFYSDLGL
ncbi:hypothetical protein ACJ2PR_16070 [Phormidesmis sp. 146-33]